ncbi:unnamed protein product [Rotaria sp. Silwood2]|nr:unnamed protein product [Rotaria sp. Silwood2]
MDMYTNSCGLQHIVGYGSNSVVIAHHNHNHHNDYNHFHSPPPRPPPPPRPIPKATSSYQLVPLGIATPLIINVPVQQPSKQQHQSQVAIRDPFILEQNRTNRGTSAYIPRYNSLDDPHMQDYYAKKFGRRSKSSKKRLTRSDALYRITIKTANVKDAGTNAKVFLSVFGSKDKICRKLLTRETMLRGQTQLSLSLNGLDKTYDNDLYHIEYKRGATDVVYIRCRDLGIIHYINLEHTGLLFEQSWLCEFVLITNVRTGRSWFFPCNKWLSLFPPGDGSLSIELFPNDRAFDNNLRSKIIPAVTEYQITVITGDKRSAGTDSQVYITLFGDNGKRTEKLHLKKSATNKNPFERNQTDEFRVKGDYVGELVKLRVEHDNTGRLAGWFLDRIVITDMFDPTTKYFANCNKWLSKDEGDGQISRDLMLYKDINKGGRSNKYRITVYTGKKLGAGTDADVFITLYGDLGESGAIVLDDKKNNFESGQKDEFTIECSSVGEINKILIAHNNKGSGPGWFLDRIIIVDLAENRTYEFPCYKWLATDEDDGQISRFLFPKKGGADDKHPTAGIPYNVTIYTGDKLNAGTDARVYIIMYNNESTSSQIFLSDGKFERKSIDLFKIDAPDNLSPLTALDIGHDDSGMGPGWYLDKVVVDCPSTGIEQTFPCNNWLASDTGDKCIERRLKEDQSLRKTRAPTVPWYIWIYTSDIRGAGTDAEVILVLYGHNGKSHNIKLRSKSDVFEAGQCDEFKVDITDVGTPFKLRVSHDNKKLFAPWHLERIEMQNLVTNKRYKFHCGRWLSKSDDDKQIIRELPAEGPGISKPLPIVKYTVDVYTGNKSSAGTDANVFINIFGECGDTGERPLEYSVKGGNKFEKNKVDSFIIEAVSLKHIRKIRIGHDGSGPGAGWFLDKVVVRPEDQRYEPATFECNRWLATDEDDGQLVRELTLKTAAQHLDKTTYNVRIKTGDIFQGGTDADVYLKIFGENGDTDIIQLRTANNTSNKFEKGRTDHFTLEFDELGKIQHIIIGHNGKNLGAGWFLDWIEIDIPMRGELYRFVCNRWLDKSEGDGKIELDLTPSDVIKKSRVIPYEVTVFTGDKSGAGTDAKVFIQIYGLNGKTEEIILKNKSDSFEQKAVDKFKLEAPDIGQIQKIRIGHNSEKFGSAWYLEKVLIQRHLSEEPDKRKRGFKSGRSQRLSQISATDPNVEEYWFVCRQWFDKSSGDKATVRELLPTDEQGNPLANRNEITYMAHVFTGNKSGAGTDANVFLTIYGEFEDTGERELRQSKTNRNKFEQNHFGSAWYLDRVEIVDPETDQTYHFICQKWLATDKEDGLICREIPALENKALRLAAARESSAGSSVDYGLEMKTIATTYKISVITSNEFGSGTNAKVYIIIFGEKNDTGKVPLVTSKTHSDPFERDHTDEFEIEAMDIGEPTKIKIGHDDSGFRPDWLLERVQIDVPKLGRTWIFPCGKWLSTSKGDCQLEAELYPQTMATEVYTPHVPYEIKVFTSKVSGAGTDANIHIEIYGVEKTTGQVVLCSKTDRKGRFQTGSVDTFVLELEDVGKDIEKIRIGHDNRGLGAAWHLDHVEIRRLDKNQKTKTFIFPCRRWFAKDEDDRSIVRDLLPEKVIEEKLDKSGQLQVREREIQDQLEMKQYIVDVYTGDKFGCGTNANVFCTIYGDKGDTGERELAHSETHTDKFERKHMDRFKIECADLGNIYKFKIRHDNAGISPDWLLSKVEVKDDIRTYVFYCEQWLTKGKDSKLERTLYEKVKTKSLSFSLFALTIVILFCSVKDYQGSMSSLGSIPRSVTGSKASLASNDSDFKNEPFRRAQRKNIMSSIAEETRSTTEEGIPYTVKVKTGEKSDAGTTANVFMRLIGRKGRQTRLIPLELMQRQHFERGKVETFSLQEPDIGDLEIVEIEHDGETLADSWFLDDITIEMPTKGRAFYFTCNEWLSKHKGDGRTKRTLKVQDSNQSSFRPLIPYEITIYTGDIEHAGCDCDVSLKLFSTTGSSSEHVIKKNEGDFERGSINPFRFELDDVGKLIKLRITIIPKSKKDRNRWYLEKVELAKLTKQNERQQTYFFGLNDWISRETEYYRDIPLTKGGKALLNNTTYRVTTKTSSVDGAGSDSNISIVISGQNGDSGELKLENSSTHMNKFERDNEDIFTFENILSLGELTKLRVSNDESAFFKKSWHLEYVKVDDIQTGQSYMFPCNKWLSSKEDDRQTIRDLVCSNDSPNSSRRGSLTPGGKVPYEIEVVTSDKQNAGTTQHGWIVIEGNKKRSEKFYMKNTPRRKILRGGQTDTFTFECRPLGEIRRIILGHEERPEYPLKTYEGREAKWHVAHITITDPSTNTKYEFPVKQWIDINNRGDVFDCADKQEDAIAQQRHRQLINYKIIVHTGTLTGAGTDANVSIILYGTLGDTGTRPLKQKGRNLFERDQVDEFIIECLDLGKINLIHLSQIKFSLKIGKLNKLHIEHDNSLMAPDWFLDKVEVINMDTDEKVTFPCNRWLGKKHDDHEIQRDLLPMNNS